MFFIKGHSNLFAAVLQEIEREDQAWEQSEKHKPKHGRLDAHNEATAAAEKVSKQPGQTKSEAKTHSGFY